MGVRLKKQTALSLTALCPIKNDCPSLPLLHASCLASRNFHGSQTSKSVFSSILLESRLESSAERVVIPLARPGEMGVAGWTEGEAMDPRYW